MGGLNKDRILFDPADAAGSDNIGAYLRAGSDGDLISSTLISGKESLDVHPVANADSGVFAEDSGHTTADKGQFILAVRNDANAVLTDTDLDYSAIAVDSAGRIKTVSSVTNNFEKDEDSVHVSGDTGAFVLAVQTAAQGALATDGDYAPFQVDSQGRLRTITDIDLSGDLVADDEVDTEDPLKIGSRAVSGALAAISASGDKANAISDMYRRIYINDSPNISAASATVTVDDTAGGIALPTTALAGRRRMIIQNTSTSRDIAVGPTATLTFANGLMVRRGESLSVEIGQNVALFGIADTGFTADVRVFELA
jgi:hypothetical protein